MPIKLEYFGRLFYVFIFCFSIFYICHNNTKNNFFENIIYILIILIFYKYERFSGLQEILIFSFLVIISKHFYLLKNNNIWYVLFIILSCNLIIWLKSEGIIFTLILIILLNISNQISKKIKFYASLLFISLVILKLIVYEYFDFTLGQISVYGSDPSNFEVQHVYLDYIFNLNFEMIVHKLKFVIPFLFYYSLTNVFFVLGCIILFALNFQKKIDIYTKILNYYFIFTIISIISIYLFSNLETERLVRTTMERIIFTSSGFYVFLIINFIKSFNKKFSK